MKTLAALALALLVAVPAGAQGLSFRPYGMFAQQSFDANQTFNAVFDSSSGSFFGGGLNITQDDLFYFDVGASRFKETGQRAFVNNGQTFKTGIPLTATITPLEFSAGYRFMKGSRIRPYAGGGIGIYRYEETSNFQDDGEAIDTRHAGAIVEGGAEIRLHTWIGVSADVHYTYVPGILGDAGISKDEGETSLGGFQFRVRFIVGK
ncbi:MAG TPA: outer membrane beta-barrel protein [Vicinamibacterales bacterium]|jgi:outer membrane protein W